MRDAEMKDYQDRLLELRGRLTGEVEGSADRLHEATQSPGEVSTLPTHNADQDSEGLGPEIALAASREQVLDAVKQALARIEEGSYGRCESCGGEILKERLDAVPYAVRCVGCERREEEAV